MKIAHLKELDGIRAIAALMVMFFHFFNSLDHSIPIIASIRKISTFGQSGVYLFFVLSGFLITRILLNTKNSPSFFSNFYVRRTLRIFPLYYLFLIIYYFLLPLIEGKPFVEWGHQFYFWIYLQNIAMSFKWPLEGPNHYWSLAIEEHFYLFWPLLIYLLDTKKIKVVIISIIAIAFVSRVFFYTNNLNLGVSYFTLSSMDELALGALLAILEAEGKLKNIKPSTFIAFFFMSVIIAGLLQILPGQIFSTINELTKCLLFAFCYACIIGFVLTVKDAHWIKKILTNGVLSYTGKISYGLYVYHPLCILYMERHFKGYPIFGTLLVSFGSAYLLSTISYYIWESRFLYLKKYFEYDMRQKKAVSITN